jgi:tetratricopeptide (TPR) repeat protein
MRITALLLFAVSLLSCTGNSSDSPFEEILSQPPYATLSDSINKQPGRDDLYFRRAVLLNKNKLPEPALADFRKAWSLKKQETYAVGVSNILLEKRPDSAIAFLEKATRDLPGSIFLHLSLARAYESAGQTDKAIQTCDEILEEDSLQVNTLLFKAELMANKNEAAGAIAALEKAYGAMPFNPEIASKLAYQYAEQKNRKALSLADTLIQKDSLNIMPGPYYVKGLYFSNTGDRARAIQFFDETIKKDHRYLNAYIEKGKILIDQKKTAEALATFELANRITPSFADAWYWMGRCQEILGDRTEARQDYEKAYELDNSFVEAKEAAEKIK